MFRRFFGFGQTDEKVPETPKTQAGDLENWTLNEELNRYEFTKNGYNYKRIPDILDPQNRMSNDFYIKNAVELADLATYDLKGARLMIDGNLTIRKEVVIMNGTIDLMYGTGVSNREHELKMDHDFTFTNGVFLNVYAVRHFMNDTDDNMKGTLEDIHGLSTINNIQASEIIRVHGNPALLRESLKTGNRSSQSTTIIKNLNYNYELVLIQDSADLQNVHIYGDTIQMSTEDEAPKILSSTNNASISCNNLQFLSKMTIQGVEIHANKITFASSLNLDDVSIEDCTLYNKLLLTANTIKVFKGNTVFVEGFCVQVEDNKTIEVGMKMYNKGDMNGKNKAITNFATVNGGSINIVRKTLHDDFEKVYQRTSEYITDYLKEGEKYTADTYVNYDVYVQWLTECVTKFGSFNIAEYKIGNTTYTDNKDVNEFITLLKGRTNVQKVEVLRAATTSSTIQFEFQHYTNGNEYKQILVRRFPDTFTDHDKELINNSQFFAANSSDNYYGDVCTTLLQLRRSIIYDFSSAWLSRAVRTRGQAIRFIHECEIIAKCKILFCVDRKDLINEWKTIEDYLANMGLVNDDDILEGSTTFYFGTNSYFKEFYATPYNTRTVGWYFDVLPLRYDFLVFDDSFPDIMAQIYLLDNMYKNIFVEKIKSISGIENKRIMFKTNLSQDVKVDFLTTTGNYTTEEGRFENAPIMNLKTIDEFTTSSYLSGQETVTSKCRVRYFYNYQNDTSIPETTNQSLFDTYEDILSTMEVEDTKDMLKKLLEFSHNTNDSVALVRDAFNRYITLKTNREEYYKCTLNSSGTEIEKSLLELDNVGSANSVTNVMTEHTSIQLTVPLHSNPKSYYRTYNDVENANFNLNTVETVKQNINNYIHGKITYSANTQNYSIKTGFTAEEGMLYLIEAQYFAGKKIIFNRRNMTITTTIDQINNENEFLSLFVKTDELTSQDNNYYCELVGISLSENVDIPLHSKSFEFTRKEGEDSYTIVTPINTLEPTVGIVFPNPGNVGGSTTYTYPNPWFEELSQRGIALSGTGIEGDMKRWEEGPEDAKWRREYMAELLYFAQQPILFSTAGTSGGIVCDPFRLPVNVASPNPILPFENIQDGLYCHVNGDPVVFRKAIDWYFAGNEVIFSLPCYPESTVSPTYAKNAFNMCIAKYLEHAKLAETDELPCGEGEQDLQAKNGTINSDILVQLFMQKRLGEQTTTMYPFGQNKKISLREHFDTLYDEIREFYLNNTSEDMEVSCGFTANQAEVIEYHPMNLLHDNLNTYETKDTGSGRTAEVPVDEVARDDFAQVYTISEHVNKQQWLRECIWKLPGQYKSYILEKGVSNEIEYWKFVPVEILLKNNSEILPKDPENPTASILIIDRYFLNKLSADILTCYVENPENPSESQIDPVKEKTMLNSQIRYMFQFSKEEFLEMAKQLILFYCVKDGKIYRDIRFSFTKQETVVIIRKGVKTIQFLEDTQSMSLLEFIVEIEPVVSDLNYNILTLPEEEFAEFTPLSNEYVYPPFIVPDDEYKTNGKLDGDKCINKVIPRFHELVSSLFNSDEYKYGFEAPAEGQIAKWKYVQRDVLTEANKIFNEVNGDQITKEIDESNAENSTSIKTKEFKGPILIPVVETGDNNNLLFVGLEEQLEEFLTREGHNLSVYKVNITSSYEIVITRYYLSTENVILNKVLTADEQETVSSEIVARALEILGYNDGRWNVKYIEDSNEVQKSVYDFSREIVHINSAIYLIRRAEGIQLPLVTDEAMQNVIQYLQIKRDEYGTDTDGFGKYLYDFLLELKQKENERKNYFYFIVHSFIENATTGYEEFEFVPRCQVLNLVERFISIRSILDCDFIEVPYPTQVVHLTDENNGLIEKCKIEYTNTRESHTTEKYTFWPMDFIAYAAVLNEETLELSEINNNNFVYFTTENLVSKAEEIEGVSVFLRRGIDNPAVVNELRTQAATGAIDFFVYWESEDETVYSAVKELKEKIAKVMNNTLTTENFKLYLYEWQLKCAYLSYDQQTGRVEKTQGVALTPVTFKLYQINHGYYDDAYELETDLEAGEDSGLTEGYTMDLLMELTPDTLRQVLADNIYIEPYPFRFVLNGEVTPDDPDTPDTPVTPDDPFNPEVDPKDIYILRDEDQNETKGWIYTGLIKRLVTKYLNGSLKGNETSWDNVTDRTMMGNDEMSNIMTLINTRYNSETEKAQDNVDLMNLLVPEEGSGKFGIIDAINLMLNKEQDFDRSKVKYSSEEIEKIMGAIDEWYSFYEPSAETFIDSAQIMIWEGMDLEYYEATNNFENRVDTIVNDYNAVYKRYNSNTRTTWTKTCISGMNTFFRVASYDTLKDNEWIQFIGEVQGIRNSWQFSENTDENKILLCIGSNYGEIWSVFGKQPGDDMPLETYFYLRKNDKSMMRTNVNPDTPETTEYDSDVIYIPKDKYNSNLVWNQDKYYHSDLYQMLFYPYYIMINDTSKFKDYINPLINSLATGKTPINYLGYVILVPN